MIETINGKAYLKVGDKVYELGGGSNIITADSVEQLPDPASVPEGTIALVKSEGGGGGGGLPVVELTTAPTGESTPLSTEENAKLSAAIGNPAIINILNVYVFVASYINFDGTSIFIGQILTDTYKIESSDGETWKLTIISNG